MRAGFQLGLIESAKKDPRIHVLTGDHGYGLFDEFRNEFPDRFHNVGVAEANLVGIASGMAKTGLRPLIYGLAAFIPNRVFEFIKLQIAIEKLPVVMVGDGAGLVYSQLGRSHQTLEDLAIIGALPEIVTMSPGSDREMRIAVEWAFAQTLPVYLRMGKMGGAYSGASASGHPQPFRVAPSGEHSRVALIAHGSMVSLCQEAQEAFDQNAFDLWSCPTIFPVDKDFLRLISSAYELVLVVEEHNPRGGLADEIRRAAGGVVKSLSARPNEGNEVGSYEWLLQAHGLSTDHIKAFISSSIQ